MCESSLTGTAQYWYPLFQDKTTSTMIWLATRSLVLNHVDRYHIVDQKER
jgi:hypothetical protein